MQPKLRKNVHEATIHRSVSSVYTPQHAELASCARSTEFFPFYGTVLHQRCNFYVVIHAKSGLKIGGEAPGPGSTICIDGKTVIGASSHRYSIDTYILLENN